MSEQPTLRDQFAMAALSGVIQLDWTEDRMAIATKAYWVADAMMKARGNGLAPLAEAPEDFKPELLKQYVTPEEWKQRTSGLGQPITEEMLDPTNHKNHPSLDGLSLTDGETK